MSSGGRAPAGPGSAPPGAADVLKAPGEVPAGAAGFGGTTGLPRAMVVVMLVVSPPCCSLWTLLVRSEMMGGIDMAASLGAASGVPWPPPSTRAKTDASAAGRAVLATCAAAVSAAPADTATSPARADDACAAGTAAAGVAPTHGSLLLGGSKGDNTLTLEGPCCCCRCVCCFKSPPSFLTTTGENASDPRRCAVASCDSSSRRAPAHAPAPSTRRTPATGWGGEVQSLRYFVDYQEGVVLRDPLSMSLYVA